MNYGGKMEKIFAPETNIIAHGDGDGTIAAAVARLNGAQGRLVCAQPFLLHKLPDLTRPAIIVDIAVDNKNPEATLEWAKRNADCIAAWIDHHEGGEALAEILGDKFIYDSSAPSCPALMAEHGFAVPVEWVAAANACDRPTEYTTTDLSVRYNSAFKVALVALQNGDKTAVEVVPTAFVEELVSGAESPLVTERATAYPVLEAATSAAFERLTEMIPGVVYTDVPEGQGGIDLTSLLVKGYKKAPVVVISTTSVQNSEPIVIVATDRKDLNLVKVFSLGSGAPFRIILTGEKADLDYVRSTFEKRKEAEELKLWLEAMPKKFVERLDDKNLELIISPAVEGDRNETHWRHYFLRGETDNGIENGRTEILRVPFCWW
jgi:hypothetical protein